MIRSTHRLLSAAVVAVLLGGLGAHLSAWGQEPKRYDDHKFARVAVKTWQQLEVLEDSGAIIANCVPGVGPMDVVATSEQLAELKRLGLHTEVLHDNVQMLFDAQRPVALRADPFEDFFLDYHEYGNASETGTVVWYMNELVTLYPTLASMVDVGSTLEARTIHGLRITSDLIADKPGVVYFGAEHAREWITPTAPLYLATYLLENYGTDATVTDLVDNIEFFLIPVFNVDGYIYTWTMERMWRKNRRDNGDGSYGVDINRNWGEGWGLDIGSSGNPSYSTYRGTAPFSEPETQVMRDFFYAHPNVRADHDIHSYGQLLLWPYGYKPDPPADWEAYADIGSTMQSLIYGVHGLTYTGGSCYTAIYPVSGGSIDWTYAALDLLSFSLELRDTGEYGFLLPPEQIIPNNEEILPALLHQTNSDWVRISLRYRFPAGHPTTITSGADTNIPLDIIAHRESINPGSARLYYRYDPSGPFIESLLTSTGDVSYEAVLPATNCTSTPQYYFYAEGDGGTTLASPKGAPGAEVYSPGVTTPGRVTFFTEDLSADPGWTTVPLWAYGQPTGQGGEYGWPDPTSGHTGINVYGYNLSGDYEADLPETHLTSSSIDCTGRYGIHLSFWRWLGVEQARYDKAYVRVSLNETDWINVWENTSEVTDFSWTFQEIDISAVADDQPTVYLRWTMGTTDASWQYCGWNIDDIGLSAAVCDSIAGDYNGDGVIDTTDFDEFILCFTSPVGPIGPGCGIFDFDSDNDVDCEDWFGFWAAWTGPPAEPPSFDLCPAFSAPTADPLPKNRYISFIPGNSLGIPQAFRVTTVSNSLFPDTVGQQKWVAAPNAKGMSRLSCSPTYRNWGFTPVHAGDQDIVPGATYAVEATLDGVDFLGPVAMATVPVWGDTVGKFHEGGWTPPDGEVQIIDATALLDGFRHLTTAPATTRCDLFPVIPDASIDILDVTLVLDAFRGFDYPFDGPSGCP